ncbi:MAG: hypothetical protein IJ760_01910 [Bacteroidales bacterium]|nr:hypothetical protein [Bacteroidales bacterium]
MKRLITLAALAAVLAVMMAACEPDNPKPVDTAHGEEPVPQSDTGYAGLIVGKWHQVRLNGNVYPGAIYKEYLADGTFIPYDTVDGVRMEHDTIVDYYYQVAGDSLWVTSPTPGYGSRQKIEELTEKYLKTSYIEEYSGNSYLLIFEFNRVSE